MSLGQNAEEFPLGARAQTLSLLDGSTQAVLDSRSVTAFQNGTWEVWKVSGHVILTVTNTGSTNAAISGLFFDPATAGSTQPVSSFEPTRR